MECDTAGEMSHSGDKEKKGNVSDVKQRVGSSRICLQTAEVCRRDRRADQEEYDRRQIQLLRRSSVAVSTSQDFDDNATITAFWR